MSVNLPQSGAVFLPNIPKTVKDVSPELYEYLKRLESAVTKNLRGQFNNSNNLAVAINSGTSGTFNVASGGHITVVNGVVSAVSTT